jgi:hypothetical protein
MGEIAKLVGLPRATVWRCLLTLSALGYIDTNGKYYPFLKGSRPAWPHPNKWSKVVRNV